MSRTTLYRIFKTATRTVQEYHNSHLSAPAIWGYLCVKYLNEERHKWICRNDNKKLWDLWKNLEVPKPIRAAHLFTMDGATIPFQHKDEIGCLFKEAHKILRTDQPDYGSHWEDIGETLINNKQSDNRMIGFGLGCTSVSDPWEYYPKDKSFLPKVFNLYWALTKGIEESRKEQAEVVDGKN